MKAIFVIGHPKSGTTLLKNLLDGHSKLYVEAEETNFYKYFCGQQYDNKEDLIRDIREKSYQKRYYIKEGNDISGVYDYSDFNSEKFESLLPESGKADLEKIIIASGIAFGNNLDSIEYWVEKSASHTFHVDKIVEEYPNAEYIFIVRDPVSNFVSYKKKHPRLTVKKFAANWNTAIDNLKYIPKEKLYLVKYEDLVANAEGIMKDIASRYGLDFEENLTIPTRAGKSWTGNSMHGVREKGIHKKSVDHANKISNYDKNYIMENCAENMKRFDYEIDFQNSELSFFSRIINKFK